MWGVIMTLGRSYSGELAGQRLRVGDVEDRVEPARAHSRSRAAVSRTAPRAVLITVAPSRQQGQFRCSDEVAGGRKRGHVQREHVAARQQFGQRTRRPPAALTSAASA